MKALRVISVLSVLLLICSAALTGDESEPATKNDPFVGTFSRGLIGESTDISMSGDIYKLTGEYARVEFKKKSESVLQDSKGVLGTLTTGQLRFADSKEPIQVLRADFAYDHFLLVKVRQRKPDPAPSA